jgi:phosphoribosylformylglycinamidine cyclo-ligase
MPSFYGEDEYDLAGFAVGVVERRNIIDGSRIKTGDQLIGLASSGLHSNGYSLVRKVLLERAGYGVDDTLTELGNGTLGEVLLTPTKIYAKTVMALMKDFDIRGMAHITGGGITENTPRMLPKGTQALIRKKTWDIPPIFKLLQKKSGVDDTEMYRAFNMGLGMVIAVPKKQVEAVIKKAAKLGEKAYHIGEIVKGRQIVKYLES